MPWSFLIDTHHHRPAAFVAFDRHWLETKPEITPRDVPMFGEHRRRPFYSGTWNYQNPMAGAKHRHAEWLSRCVEGKAPLRTRLQTKIELDPCVDVASAQRVPGARGASDDSERHNGVAVLSSQSHGNMTDADGRRGERHGSVVSVIHAQQCHIRRWIAPDY